MTLHFNLEYCFNQYADPLHLCHSFRCVSLCSAQLAQPYAVALYGGYLRECGGDANKLNTSIWMGTLPQEACANNTLSPNYCNSLLLFSFLPNTYLVGNLNLSPTFEQDPFLLLFIFNFPRFFFSQLKALGFFLIKLIPLCLSWIITYPYFSLTSF